jgi:hypothetical protein
MVVENDAFEIRGRGVVPLLFFQLGLLTEMHRRRSLADEHKPVRLRAICFSRGRTNCLLFLLSTERDEGISDILQPRARGSFTAGASDREKRRRRERQIGTDM